MALVIASSTLAYVPQLYVAAPASTVQFRAAAPPVMSEMTSRRAALLGLAAFAAPGAANAAAKTPTATPFWKVNKNGILARSTKEAAATNKKIKCEVSKPCATGAGLAWDPKALGVAAADKRSFAKKGGKAFDGSGLYKP